METITTTAVVAGRSLRVEAPADAFIDGRFQPAQSRNRFETVNPATGEVLGSVASCGEADVDRAVAAARRSFDDGCWSRAAPEARKEVLLRLANLVRENA